MQSGTNFKYFSSPSGKKYLIPSDLNMMAPSSSSLPRNMQDKLVYIPWDDKYLNTVPTEYQPFFEYALPYLGVRTTDVHVAICLGYLEEFIEMFPRKIDRKIVYLALILHDVGWSKLTDSEIAQSLGVTGLSLSQESRSPKEKHAKLGHDLAKQLIDEYTFSAPLNSTQKKSILDAVLYHDKPWELAENGEIPLEVKIVCDADHLWSFTHENFWQDTVRKGIDPRYYIVNLENDINEYFVTPQGKTQARQLLEDIKLEVAQLGK